VPPGRQQFGCRLRLVGSEHHAERREHDIEAGIGKRQRLGVTVLEIHDEPLHRGPLAPALQQCGHVVDTRHLAVAAGSRERGRATAAGDIEHAAAGPEVDRLAQGFAHDHQPAADCGEIGGWLAHGRLRSVADAR